MVSGRFYIKLYYMEGCLRENLPVASRKRLFLFVSIWKRSTQSKVHLMECFFFRGNSLTIGLGGAKISCHTVRSYSSLSPSPGFSLSHTHIHTFSSPLFTYPSFAFSQSFTVFSRILLRSSNAPRSSSLLKLRTSQVRGVGLTVKAIRWL